jgi:hypothetical protein
VESDLAGGELLGLTEAKACGEPPLGAACERFVEKPRRASARSGGSIVRVPQVEITQVDERDSSWEDHGPRFRVYLHRDPGPHAPAGGSTDTYDITGADVAQVIDWAQRRAGDVQTYSIALVRDDGDAERRDPDAGRGLVWLLGVDGNDVPAPGSSEATAQQRMLHRMAEPIRIPHRDRMPAS